MPSRLETQKPPVKAHRRSNSRWDRRGYDSNPHEVWGDTASSRGAAAPGASFVEPTVVAQDSTNAARLGPLGYVALPTSAWTSGQAITVSGFLFNWSGSAWAAGAHA